MFCGECGHRWAPDEIATARFCAECGAPREDIPTPTPAPAPTPVPIIAAPSSAAKSITSTNSCSKCFTPFADPSGTFCGECGHQRVPPNYSNNSFRNAPGSLGSSSPDDGDLFGISASSANPSSSIGYTTAQIPGSSSLGTSSQYGSFSAKNASTSVPFEAQRSFNSNTTPGGYSNSSIASPVITGQSPVASVTVLSNSSAVSNASAMLSNISLSSRDRTEKNEPDGNGIGVAIRSVIRARNMDSLTTRLQISAAVEKNKTSPCERVEGYNMTKVNDVITVVHCETMDPIEEKYYDERTLPDNEEWQQLLRRHKQNGTKFTDPQFPPDVSSLYRDSRNKRHPNIEENVWKWRRLSEFFNETAYVQITMVDDPKKLICSIAIKSTAEAESILQVIKMNPLKNIDSSCLSLAKEAVNTGLSKRRREHLLLLTTNMITHMSEYVENGIQRFDLLWQKSLLDHYSPLKFAGVGEGSAYRIDTGDAGIVSRIAVLVPVYFQAQGTCLFDRSLESPKSSSTVSGVGVEPSEVCQGRLADSYLFGALSILSTSPNALAQVFPTIDTDLIDPQRVELSALYPKEQQYNEQGVYAVRFWRNNRSRIVVIDDYVPCSQYGKPVFGSFTGSNGKFEIWSMLIEKAYAKLHGGYEAIIGGQESYALQDLYGGVPSSYKLQELPEQAAWESLSKSLQSGSLLGGINDDLAIELPTGLKKSQAYGIMKLVELQYNGENVRLIQLRNSYGFSVGGASGSLEKKQKWGGAWSNEDPRWKAFSRAQKIECCFQFRQDNSYWMEFCSFYCFFNSIIESKNLYNFKSVPDGLGNPIAPTLSVHIISGEWNGMTSAGRDGMHLNPQYQIFSPVTKGCVLTVHLEQPSRRMNMLMEYPFYVAPVVLKNGEARQRKLDLAQDAVATGTFISNRSCLLEALLENPDTSKPYVVIPATYEGNLPRTSFYLTLFTSKPTAIIPISDTASLPICCVCQRPLVGTFRTFTHANGVDRVCKDTCVQIYRERNTPVCVECGLGIEPIEGRFSGRMFTLPDGTSVHAECIDAYRVRIADKCQHCGHAITPIPGKFDGKYFETPNGKCHSECMEAYQMSTSKRCLHCREPIMKITGRFDGRFYKVSGTIDEQVHFECWDSYQLSMAPKCVHCFEPIMKVPQKFDGRFYELSDGSGKVHFECWESFRVLRS